MADGRTEQLCRAAHWSLEEDIGGKVEPGQDKRTKWPAPEQLCGAAQSRQWVTVEDLGGRRKKQAGPMEEESAKRLEEKEVYYSPGLV